MDLVEEKLALAEMLKKKFPRRFEVAVMPHFCIDNFVHCSQSYESFERELASIASQGGGNIALKQELHVGGKAANCASALSSLGVYAHLIAKTSDLGYKLLEHFFKGKSVDLSHVHRDGELAFTTAIELKEANIMISYAGSLSSFGPEVLSTSDKELIKNVDVVCVSDWGLNEKGTELAEHVFRIAKSGKAKTFFDPGDPTPKGKNEKAEIAKVKEMLKAGLVDMLSVNENEVLRYGGLDFLRRFTRVELHTEKYVMSITKNSSAKVPTFAVKPLRLTGAGDAWNAGNILGACMQLSDIQRLMLANAVAAYYISDPRGMHASIEELASFLKSAKLRQGT